MRAALRHDKPFAVVPCCVFPGLFTHRRLRSGAPVHSYEQFCTWLVELVPGCEVAFLPFIGRNRVLFRRPRGARTAAPQWCCGLVAAQPPELPMPDSSGGSSETGPPLATGQRAAAVALRLGGRDERNGSRGSLAPAILTSELLVLATRPSRVELVVHFL